MRRGRTANDPQLHPTRLTVFVLDGIERVFQRVDRLPERFTVIARIVLEPVK
jgi:hypothetical protein